MFKKYMLVSVLVVSSAVVCMEPIKVEPFTAQEIESLQVYSFMKKLHPELEKEASPEAVQVNSNDDLSWQEIEAEPLCARLAVSPQAVKDQLYKQFYDGFGGWTFVTSCDAPIGREWSAVKKAFALFLRVGADVGEVKYKEEVRAARKCFMLQCALWQDDLEFAKFLLEHGANPNETRNHEPIYCEVRSAKMAQLLMAHGVDYSKNSKAVGYTLLHTACNRQAKADLVTFYLEQGFQVNVVTVRVRTPLMVLARTSHYEPLERVKAKLVALLNAGADTTIKTEDGESVIEVARKGLARADYHPESAALFIKMIEEVQAKNAQGM